LRACRGTRVCGARCARVGRALPPAVGELPQAAPRERLAGGPRGRAAPPREARLRGARNCAGNRAEREVERGDQLQVDLCVRPLASAWLVAQFLAPLRKLQLAVS